MRCLLPIPIVLLTLDGAVASQHDNEAGKTGIKRLRGKKAISLSKHDQRHRNLNFMDLDQPEDNIFALRVEPNDADSVNFIEEPVSMEPSIAPTESLQPSMSYLPSSSSAPSEAGTGSGTTVSSRSNMPSQETTTFPSTVASEMPTIVESRFTTDEPSGSIEPSLEPSGSPRPSDSIQPSLVPSESNEPSRSSMPSIQRSDFPSGGPSSSVSPSTQPTTSFSPTITAKPTLSSSPSGQPSTSSAPSILPSFLPTLGTTTTTPPSTRPSVSPSDSPTTEPSSIPTEEPSLSVNPSMRPTISQSPTTSPMPSVSPAPSGVPTRSGSPSAPPSLAPTLAPTTSFEPTVVSGNATARISGVYGDPHVITFDNLEFDCQAHGEFTMLTVLGNSDSFESQGRSLADSEFEIQERFTAIESECGQASVSTGFVVQAGGLPKVQVSIPRSDNDTSDPVINGCPVNFFSDGGQLTTPDPELDAFGVKIVVDENDIAVLYPSGLFVSATVRFSENFGCFFRVQVGLPRTFMAGVTLGGLLGQPDGFDSNDWLDRNGNVLEQPDNEQGYLFGTAYNYCVSNWCIFNEIDSLFTYTKDEDFESISGCNVPYQSEDLESKVNDELLNGGLLKNICCGDSEDPDDCDFGCLIDGFCGSPQDAQNAAADQDAIFELKEAFESTTTPEPSPEPSSEPSVSPEPSSTPSISPAPSSSPAPSNSPLPSALPTSSPAPSNFPSVAITDDPTLPPTFLPTDSGGNPGVTAAPTISPAPSVDTSRERPTPRPTWRGGRPTGFRRPTSPTTEFFEDLLRKWKRAKKQADARYRNQRRRRRRRRFRRRRRSSWNRSRWKNSRRARSGPWWNWWS